MRSLLLVVVVVVVTAAGGSHAQTCTVGQPETCTVDGDLEFCRDGVLEVFSCEGIAAGSRRDSASGTNRAVPAIPSCLPARSAWLLSVLHASSTASRPGHRRGHGVRLADGKRPVFGRRDGNGANHHEAES